MLSRFPVIASSLVVLLSKIKQLEICLYQQKMTKFLLNILAFLSGVHSSFFCEAVGLISTYADKGLQQSRSSPCPHCRMLSIACWKGGVGAALHHSLRVSMQGALPSRVLPGVLYHVWERLLALPCFVLSVQSDWTSSFTNVLHAACMFCKNQGSFEVR